MNAKPIIVLLITIIAQLQLLYAQEWYQSRVIILDTWADLTQIPNILKDRLNAEDPFESSPKYQIQLALDNTKKIAVELYTDMIYGYRFEYTPRDSYRNISESWKFTKIASISDTDPNLIDISRAMFDNQLNVVYRYNLNEDQVRWLENWESADALGSGGEGMVSIFDIEEVEGKLKSIREALKVAIRNRLQASLANKPLQIKGIVKLIEQPYLAVSSGVYRAKVKIRLKVEEVIEQQAF